MKMSVRILRATRNTGLSQAGLVDRLQIRRSAAYNWESVNDIQPSLQNLIALAKVCGVSFNWLGTRRGRMNPESDPLGDIGAADAELVEAADERELLAILSDLPRKPRQPVFDLVETIHASRKRSRRGVAGFKAKL